MSKEIFYTSDLHFNHDKIVAFADRPWAQEENTEVLIRRWNCRVGAKDDVYHLGDFSFLSSVKDLPKLVGIIMQLKGNKHFILGNHCDRRLWQLVEDLDLPQVQWIKDYNELKVDGQKIVMSHYPMEVWNQSHRGSWMLHGHCHGSLPPRGKRLDVGIDNHPYFAVYSHDEVVAHMAKQPIAILDHHTGATG